MMKSLDSSNSQYSKLRNGVISRSAKLFVYVPISGFRHFTFHSFLHFDTPVMKCFDTSTPGIWESKMELFFGLQNSC
jgi:hypothetical protein